MQGTRMFTVDKFLGLNEAADGNTELRMGEASKMENWLVTDAFNLTTRPGIQRVDTVQGRNNAPILASWAGFAGEQEYLVICDFAASADRVWMYQKNEDGSHSLVHSQTGALGLTTAEDAFVKIFTFGGRLYIMSAKKTVFFDGETFVEEEPYIPLVIVGAAPAGGGENLEGFNLLSGKRRMTFSADGTATAFVLPEEAKAAERILIDNVEYALATAGSFSNHTFTFNKAPAKGVGNVEITYSVDAATTETARMQIIRCPLVEEYNGSTDTRLFVAGDGSNRCYYSGVTEAGDVTPLYFPALNEVAVDMSGSPVTGMVRHYSKLLVFKPDGTFTISYEPVTLPDGNTVAGFYLRNMNREFGHEVLGQVQTTNNYPRTVTKDGIYEWRITSSYYKDERYAKRISDMVDRTLRGTDIRKIVTCDDDFSKTYYVFLNDEAGTVLVNRYDLGRDGVWCLYRSRLCRNIRKAMVFGGRMVFMNEQEAFFFDESLTMDAPEEIGGEALPIKAVWESGFQHFGADYRRKYSSQIYISILPESKAELTVTAATDKRDDYMEKTIEQNVFNWEYTDFTNWTFDVNDTPRIRRVRLKVKKFVYYKLIFRADSPGAKTTVMGYDQQVRFASMAK